MKSDFNGLKQLSKNLKEIEPNSSVPLTDILNDSFLLQNTPFSNLNNLFEQGGFKIETLEDFNEIDEDELNLFISKNTKYDSYKEMLGNAGAIYMKNLLFKGF